MPKVPMYDSPTVAPQELPVVRQSTPFRMMEAATIGPNQMIKAGQALDGFGTVVAQAQAASQNANLIAGQSGILHGSPDDPSSGYLNKKGQDAVDSYQDTVKALKDLGSATGPAGLANQAYIQSAIQQATEHRNRQAGVYQDSVDATQAKAGSDSAALSFRPGVDSPNPDYDPERPELSSPYQLGLHTVIASTKSTLDRNGILDPALREARVKDAIGQAQLSTISHMTGGGSKALNGDQLKAAQDYFAAVKDNLAPEQQDKISRVLESSAKGDAALRLALEVRGVSSNIGKQESILDAKFKSGEINSEVHEMALQKLRADNAQRRSEQNENDKSVLGAVYDDLNKGIPLAEQPPDRRAYITQRGLGPSVDMMANRVGKESDKHDLVAMRSNVGQGGPDDITKLTDAEWIVKKSKLSLGDAKELDRERSNSLQGIPINGKDPSNVNLSKFNTIFNSRLPNLSKADHAELWSAVNTAVIQDQRIAGHPFNDDQLAKSIDSYLVHKVATPGALWGTNQTPLYKVHAKDIPLSDERRIREAFVKHTNRQPTSDELHGIFELGSKHE